MKSPLRAAIRKLGLALSRALGTELVDCRSGLPLGRALLVPWRGRILVIGYEGVGLRPVFRTQSRLNYWKQELEFTAHPPPDFPHEPRP